MKTLIEYVKDLYNYSKRQFILCLALMVADGLTSGMGVVMLIPLLSLVGVGSQSGGIPFLGVISGLLGHYDVTMRLVIILLIYLFLVVMQALIGRALSIVNSEIIQGYTKHLRVTLYKGVIETEWSYFKGRNRADIANAFTNEISHIASGTTMFLRVVSQIIVAIFQLYIAFLMSVPMTLFVLVCGVAVLKYMSSTFKASKQLGASLRHINQELTGRTLEQLSCIKESKSYGIEEAQCARFEVITDKARNNLNDFARLQSRTTLIYKIWAAVAVSALFFVSVVYLKIDPASLIVVVYIFARLWPSLSSFQGNYQNVLAMLPSYTALKESFRDLRAHVEKIDTRAPSPHGGLYPASVRFEDVCFRYAGPGSFALKHICFVIPAKSMTALVGKSGAGKSTIVDLLLGLLKPDHGTIMADDIVIGEGSLQAWRRSISYVPQESFLFNDTIRENFLIFNPGASEEDMGEALRLSDAEFVWDLPDGLDTIIGDDGLRLSGGERQRIVLARALLRKPSLLVLDEATSSLDGESEYRIQKAVETLSDRIAVIVIAHRFSTIRSADNILVLDGGEIVERGTYVELSQKEEGVFKKMWSRSGEISDGESVRMRDDKGPSE